MKRMKTLVSLALLLWAGAASAQLGSNPLRKGNQLYEEEKFDQAEVRYRKAIDKAEGFDSRAEFNLGDALYRQERFEEAAGQFAKVAEMAQDKELKARALHNKGNSQVEQEQWQEAVESYKEALRNDPSSQNTRENLARAMRKLKQQQQQQQKQDKDQQDQQQNKQQQKEQDQQQQQNQQQKQGDQKDGDPQDQQQSDQKKKQEGEQQGKPRKDRISREDAERLLKSLNADEQEVQQKVNKEKIKGRPVKTEKDW